MRAAVSLSNRPDMIFDIPSHAHFKNTKRPVASVLRTGNKPFRRAAGPQPGAGTLAAL